MAPPASRVPDEGTDFVRTEGFGFQVTPLEFDRPNPVYGAGQKDKPLDWRNRHKVAADGTGDADAMTHVNTPQRAKQRKAEDSQGGCIPLESHSSSAVRIEERTNKWKKGKNVDRGENRLAPGAKLLGED